MGKKIIIISRRWPQTLLGRFGQNLKLAPRKTGRNIFRTYADKRKTE
ncbi:MAG: hypothetical protein PHY77_00415 [Desulfotomaculaceae bacterium]|nr:hypothetical protein [Desulfotomaculaceae bacterium]